MIFNCWYWIIPCLQAAAYMICLFEFSDEKVELSDSRFFLITIWASFISAIWRSNYKLIMPLPWNGWGIKCCSVIPSFCLSISIHFPIIILTTVAHIRLEFCSVLMILPVMPIELWKKNEKFSAFEGINAYIKLIFHI